MTDEEPFLGVLELLGTEVLVDSWGSLRLSATTMLAIGSLEGLGASPRHPFLFVF